MTTPLRIYEMYLPRLRREKDWETSHRVLDGGPGFLSALSEVLEEAAKRAGLELVSMTPRIGWLYTIPGTKREIPCGEHSDGARPVWVWEAK